MFIKHLMTPVANKPSSNWIENSNKPLQLIENLYE